MANASLLFASLPVRLLLVGFPGSGKTGSLASLVNAGFKMRMIDFDGNYEPLIQHILPARLGNLDIVHLSDDYFISKGPVENVGIPRAFSNAFSLMDEWKYKDADGTEVNLGKSKNWGPDTIVVLDGLTGLNDAAMNRSRKMQNKTLMDTADRTYNLAMAEELAFIKKFTSNYNGFHSITLSHLKMVGPKDVRKGDTDIAKDIKEQVNALIETKYYPNVLGWGMPQQIGGEWPAILLAEKKTIGNKVHRYIKDVSGAELDLKFPAMAALPDKLSIETGMLEVFKTLSPRSVALVEEQLKNG